MRRKNIMLSLMKEEKVVGKEVTKEAISKKDTNFMFRTFPIAVHGKISRTLSRLMGKSFELI